MDLSFMTWKRMKKNLQGALEEINLQQKQSLFNCCEIIPWTAGKF